MVEDIQEDEAAIVADYLTLIFDNSISFMPFRTLNSIYSIIAFRSLWISHFNNEVNLLNSSYLLDISVFQYNSIDEGTHVLNRYIVPSHIT